MAGTYLLTALAASGSEAGLVIYTILLAVAACLGLVTALKGLWLWVIAGLLTTGLAFLISAFLPAKPGSLWARRIARRRTASDAQPQSGR